MSTDDEKKEEQKDKGSSTWGLVGGLLFVQFLGLVVVVAIAAVVIMIFVVPDIR